MEELQQHVDLECIVDFYKKKVYIIYKYIYILIKHLFKLYMIVNLNPCC